MSLASELSEYVDSEIAVIMNDGNGYRGALVKYDKEVIILKDIYETSCSDIDWVESPGQSPAKTIKGYVPWRRVTLPRLIIRVEMVLRIWPWQPLEDDENGGEGKTKVKYTRERRVKSKKKKAR